MTDLADACATIAELLPIAQALTTEPDTDGTHGGCQPGSRPPWNPAAASAVMDAHEGVRRLEASLRLAVTGHTGPRRGGSDANTMAAIRAVEALGNAVTDPAMAARLLTHWAAAIEQLPAIDEAEPWLRVQVACPYCEIGMLRLARRAGRVTCLRYGACLDRDRNHPVGLVQQSAFGQPMVAWGDGFIQYGAVDDGQAAP